MHWEELRPPDKEACLHAALAGAEFVPLLPEGKNFRFHIPVSHCLSQGGGRDPLQSLQLLFCKGARMIMPLCVFLDYTHQETHSQLE